MSLEPFRPLPLKERWFVRGRLFTAPLDELAARAPVGLVADIGCGHGALISLLLQDPRREVIGVDPDPRKMAWARASVGRSPRVRLVEGTIDTLVDRYGGALDGVLVADVLYLLPLAQWPLFLGAARALLKPGGRLLLKEAEADQSWKHYKCLAQELLMVKLLRRTKGSGGLGLQGRTRTEELLRQAGFAQVKTASLARGYSTPHVLFEATA